MWEGAFPRFAMVPEINYRHNFCADNIAMFEFEAENQVPSTQETVYTLQQTHGLKAICHLP